MIPPRYLSTTWVLQSGVPTEYLCSSSVANHHTADHESLCVAVGLSVKFSWQFHNLLLNNLDVRIVGRFFLPSKPRCASITRKLNIGQINHDTYSYSVPWRLHLVRPLLTDSDASRSSSCREFNITLHIVQVSLEIICHFIEIPRGI